MFTRGLDTERKVFSGQHRCSSFNTGNKTLTVHTVQVKGYTKQIIKTNQPRGKAVLDKIGISTAGLLIRIGKKNHPPYQRKKGPAVLWESRENKIKRDGPKVDPGSRLGESGTSRLCSQALAPAFPGLGSSKPPSGATGTRPYGLRSSPLHVLQALPGPGRCPYLNGWAGPQALCPGR